MITEDYCSFKLSKLLKEKGFDVPCLASYHIEYPENNPVWSPKPVNDEGWMFMNAPTHQMAMKWLRDVHNLHIEIMRNYDYSTDADNRLVNEWWNWSYRIISVETASIVYIPNFYEDGFDTYEEAVEAALKYCLTDLI